jgi:DNA helicase IV
LDDEDDVDESGSLEDLDSRDPEMDADTMQLPKGAFTRSDFPLLASIARVFLAMPEEAMAEPERYKGVGFLLPDEKVRYDHLIIDEGQDFTYAEIHLVRSLVESTRRAITVCGDPLQRMDWKSGFSSLETVRPGDNREFQVQKNYRQTRELCDWVHRLSRCLFGQEATTMEQGGTHGPRPVVYLFSEMREVVPVAAKTIGAWFEEERNPFTAVLAIGFEPRMQKRFTKLLRELLEDDGVVVEKVVDGRLIERGRVNVCEVPTVKGLEFDGVFVWVSRAACELLRQSTPQAKITKNMLYVSCSRAKRHLTVVFEGDVPDLEEAGLLSN